jgi:glycosyltransferase involved in cell wall biosynthesis
MPETISVIIPAHNEESTVHEVVTACMSAALTYDRSAKVTVIADHCGDRTAEVADSAGANVIERKELAPSKAHAVQLGISATSGSIVSLFDADCVAVKPHHLAQLLEPVIDRRATQAVGVLNYVGLATLVQRFPWSSGQRVIRRDAFDWNDSRLSEYRLEVLINEYVGRSRGLTEAVILRGMGHWNKVTKLGLREGLLADLAMWKSISGLVLSDCDLPSMERYLEGVVLTSEFGRRRVSRLEARLGYIGLRSLCGLIDRFPEQVFGPAPDHDLHDRLGSPRLVDVALSDGHLASGGHGSRPDGWPTGRQSFTETGRSVAEVSER